MEGMGKGLYFPLVKSGKCQKAPLGQSVLTHFVADCVYQNLSMHHDWHVKNSIVNLLIRLKGNLKQISRNLLSPWGVGGIEHRYWHLNGASNVELASQKLGHG